jgi:hypothetical protein
MREAMLVWLLVTAVLLITSTSILAGGKGAQRWLTCFLVWLVVSVGWIVTLIWSLLV